MKLLLLLGAILCLAVAEHPSLTAQTKNSSSPGASTHTGLDGSAYASIEPGYTSAMASGIEKRFFSDAALKQPDAHGTIEIECTVKRDGTLAKVKVLQSSGNRYLDSAAVAAAKESAPLKDLPDRFKGARFRMTFMYNLPSTPDRPACNALQFPDYKKAGGNVQAPKPLKFANPEYSEAARRLKYQGSVILALTVTADGTPSEVCVQRGMGHGLDENAVAAVKSTTFSPATENGTPVSVRISEEIEFRLY